MKSSAFLRGLIAFHYSNIPISLNIYLNLISFLELNNYLNLKYKYLRRLFFFEVLKHIIQHFCIKTFKYLNFKSIIHFPIN